MTISAEKVANVYEYVYVRIYMYISRYMCICTCTYFICIYNLLMKHINLRSYNVNWSSGKNRYGKTNTNKKKFVKQSQRNLNSTRKFCLNSTKVQQKISFYD